MMTTGWFLRTWRCRGQATCTSTTESPNANFVFLTCPLIALEPMPACDSMLALQFRLRTSTFAGYGDAGLANPVCSPSASTDIELQQRVICPTARVAQSVPRTGLRDPPAKVPEHLGQPGQRPTPLHVHDEFLVRRTQVVVSGSQSSSVTRVWLFRPRAVLFGLS